MVPNIKTSQAPSLDYKLEQVCTVQFSSISGTLSGNKLRTGVHSMYLCVCLCAHARLCVCMYVWMYDYKHVRLYVFLCVCVYVCIYVREFLCMYVRVYVFLCVCHVCAYICMHAGTHV